MNSAIAETATGAEPCATAEADDSLLEMLERFERLGRAPEGYWRTRLRIVPPAVMSFLRASVRVPFVRDAVLQAAEDELLDDLPLSERDMAVLEARWRTKLTPAHCATTLRWLRQLRDQLVRSFHAGQVYTHPSPRTLPPTLREWRPKRGQLVIDDFAADPRGTSLGHAPFLESTPPLVVRYAYGRWLEGAVAAGKHPSNPGAWDVTAGSGTGHDVLTALGVQVVSTDLTPCCEHVAAWDLRKLGMFCGHSRAARRRLRRLGFRFDYEAPVVARPDLVLIDPPSRGEPTPAEFYVGQWPGRDFALLPRDAWIGIVAAVATYAVALVAERGAVSLLLRCGTRDRQRVIPDESVARDVKSRLGPGVRVLEEVSLVFRRRVRQASLGSTRAPAVHLLLGRAT